MAQPVPSTVADDAGWPTVPAPPKARWGRRHRRRGLGDAATDGATVEVPQIQTDQTVQIQTVRQTEHDGCIREALISAAPPEGRRVLLPAADPPTDVTNAPTPAEKRRSVEPSPSSRFEGGWACGGF